MRILLIVGLVLLVLIVLAGEPLDLYRFLNFKIICFNCYNKLLKSRGRQAPKRQKPPQNH
jgi:hypothetical protein